MRGGDAGPGHLWKLDPPIYRSSEGGERKREREGKLDLGLLDIQPTRPDDRRLSSVRAARTHSRYFASPRGFFASPFPRPLSRSRPVGLLPYEFRLNESPRRLHRFPPGVSARVTRARASARRLESGKLRDFRISVRLAPILYGA